MNRERQAVADHGSPFMIHPPTATVGAFHAYNRRMILLAALPIVTVLTLMILLHWTGQRAGLAGWLVGLAAGAIAFGLTPQVFLVSQLKGLYLSFVVLFILWPALLLYNIVNQAGGIRAVSNALARALPDRGLLLLTLAWAFSGMLEGLAGFGIPIAIVAPMMVGLGVDPVIAVAAVAVGHSWSVTFGDMGVIFSTLLALVKLEPEMLIPLAALMLGAAAIACGLGAAFLLKQSRHWKMVVGVGIGIAAAQYGLAAAGLTPLSGFGAGLAGVILLLMFGRRGTQARAAAALPLPLERKQLQGAFASYGGLSLLMGALFLVRPLQASAAQLALPLRYPGVVTAGGFATPDALQVFRPLTNPGSIVLLAGIVSFFMLRRMRVLQPGGAQAALQATWRSGVPTSLGIIAMVGLSALMDHTGMTLLLAQGLSALMGRMYPLASPLVGMLGAFATGSNNNSNVLFATLQQNAALILGMDQRLLIAAQTTGGSLGSMIAPAKILVGCSTVGLARREGEALKLTLPYGIAIGLGAGLLALLLVNVV